MIRCSKITFDKLEKGMLVLDKQLDNYMRLVELTEDYARFKYLSSLGVTINNLIYKKDFDGFYMYLIKLYDYD
ncbi:hypothetical protein [uncultured Clostridium sp.]|uniref:hypothetical protein n=1 Tax=uncultured Clostridium sp. TaxID=59620 RepID=UPI003217F6E4